MKSMKLKILNFTKNEQFFDLNDEDRTNRRV